MNWDAVGAVAELLGSLAVLATLAYLAVQVRHSRALLEENRKFSLSQVHSDRTQSWMNFHWMTMQSDSLAEIMTKFRGSLSDEEVEKLIGELSPIELTTMRSHAWNMILHQDNNLYQNELGLLDEFVLNSTRNTIRIMMPRWKALGVNPLPRVQAEFERLNEESST